MSIASEITRISGNIAAAYTALDGKGATLPESQNSDNLADTISTISAGGGGGAYLSGKRFNDFNEEEFNAAIRDLELLVPNNYADSAYGSSLSTLISNEAIPDIESNGWVITNGDTQYPRFVTISMSTNYNKLYVFKSVISAYKLPPNTTIEEYSGDSSQYLVTFNGDNRVFQFVTPSTYQYPSGFLSSIGCTSSSKGGYIGCQWFRGYCLKQWTTSTETISDYSDIIGSWNDGAVASFKLPANIKINLSNFLSGASSANDAKDCIDVIKYLESAGVDLLSVVSDTIVDSEYISFSNSVKSAIQYLFGTNAKEFPLLDLTSFYASMGRTKIPFIIDLSSASYTSDYTLIKKVSAFGKAQKLIFTDLRIILPSCNVKLSDDNSVSCPLNLASYQYLAENAPTVSNKTLSVGYQIYSFMDNNTNWASVKTTLEGKGWTVSQW